MTVVYTHVATQKLVFLMKGALESVMACSQNYILRERLTSTLSEDTKEDLYNDMRKIAETGMRVIALAAKVMEADSIQIEEIATMNVQNRDKYESGFLSLGLVGIHDPPRPETASSVAKAKEAGMLLIC